MAHEKVEDRMTGEYFDQYTSYRCDLNYNLGNILDNCHGRYGEDIQLAQEGADYSPDDLLLSREPAFEPSDSRYVYRALRIQATEDDGYNMTQLVVERLDPLTSVSLCASQHSEETEEETEEEEETEDTTQEETEEEEETEGTTQEGTLIVTQYVELAIVDVFRITEAVVNLVLGREADHVMEAMGHAEDPDVALTSWRRQAIIRGLRQTLPRAE